LTGSTRTTDSLPMSTNNDASLLDGLATFEPLTPQQRATYLEQAKTEASDSLPGLVEELVARLRDGGKGDAAKAIEIEEVIDNAWDMYVGDALVSSLDEVAGELDDDDGQRETDARAVYARIFKAAALAGGVDAAIVARVDRG